MTALRQKVLNYINELPDSKLAALKPILTLLTDDTVRIETDLTEEEREIVKRGREEYAKGGFVPLDSISI